MKINSGRIPVYPNYMVKFLEYPAWKKFHWKTYSTSSFLSFSMTTLSFSASSVNLAPWSLIYLLNLSWKFSTFLFKSKNLSLKSMGMPTGLFFYKRILRDGKKEKEASVIHIQQTPSDHQLGPLSLLWFWRCRPLGVATYNLDSNKHESRQVDSRNKQKCTGIFWRSFYHKIPWGSDTITPFLEMVSSPATSKKWNTIVPIYNHSILF